MMTLFINAHLVSPDVDWARAFVLIGGERILACGEMESVPQSEGVEVIDLEGRLLMPGFIDIHAHGAAGADVCDGTLESLEMIARKKLAEGVTTWLPTTLTQPREKLREIVRVCCEFQAEEKWTRCPGIHLEGPYINAEKAGAQNPQFVRDPDLEELRELAELCPVSLLSLAPEMPGAMEMIREATAMGLTCSAAHTAADSEMILQAQEAGLRHLTHFSNAMTGLHHREIGAVGVGLSDSGLMLELISDGVHLSQGMLSLLAQVVSVERLMVISDSTAASWMDDGEMNLGGLEVCVEGGEARLKEGGALAGSAIRFNEAVKIFSECANRSLDQVVKATSWNQARSLGLEKVGRIEKGYWADLVVLEEDFSVWKTFVGGVEK